MGICERSASIPRHLGADATGQAARRNRAAKGRRRQLLVQDLGDRSESQTTTPSAQAREPAARAYARDARFRLVGVERNDDLLALDPALANEQRAANRPRR